MSRKDLPLYIGATWFIDQVAVDRFGAPLDLTGGSVEFRLASSSGLLVSLFSSADIDIASGTGGGYTIKLAANDARQASLAAMALPLVVDYEIDAITASGIVAVQNAGKILLLRSLRSRFPGSSTPDTTAPTITSSASFSVNENTSFSTTATASETVTWAKGGTDASLVTLNTSTGAWSVGPQVNASKPSVVFTLTATDTSSNVSAPQTITLTINAVGGGSSSPSLDFSDLNNSGYLALFGAGVVASSVSPSLDFSLATNSGYAAALGA